MTIILVLAGCTLFAVLFILIADKKAKRKKNEYHHQWWDEFDIFD